MSNLPAISGKRLVKLLKSAGCSEGRQTRHGVCLTKRVTGRTLVTFVQDTNEDLPTGTLHDILGTKQTRIRSTGFRKLLGLK